MTASFKVRLLQSTRFAGFAQVGIATITVGVPGVQLTPGRVLVRLGYGPTKPRDYPRALCYTIEEFLVYTIAHELHHLTVSQYRGDLGALDAGDPDTPELTSAILNAIGTFDLEKMWRRMDLDTFTEERGCDVYGLQRHRIWRRRGSP